MGEHPSPGPAVAACAEAERIEELEPEAEERLPAAPEDVSAPSCAPQTFWGGATRGDVTASAPYTGDNLEASRLCHQSVRDESGARSVGEMGLPQMQALAPYPAQVPTASLRDTAPATAPGTCRLLSPLPAAGAVPGTRRFPAEAAASL